MHTFSTRNIQTAKKMHWQFRIELVKHMLSNAWQQPWGIVPLPDPLNCSLCWLINTLLSPYQAKKGVGESIQAMLVSYVMSARGIVRCWFEDSYTPKKYTSYWCPICKCALCIDPCFRLYHTEKDYTSEIIKNARMSVKCIQKDAQHV